MSNQVEFTKIVLIGTQPEYSSRLRKQIPANVFCKIEIKQKDNKGLALSISGVVLGSCGQIYDDIEINHFADGWNQDLLNKFITIWKEWHLNDMNAYTEDMKKAGWDKLSSTPIYKYSYSFTTESYREAEQLKKDIINAATLGEEVNLDDRQKRLLNSKGYQDIYAYEQPVEAPEFMELSTRDFSTKQPKIESKTLGWVSVSDHPDGLLGKELNGFKYGHAWYFHKLPDEVITFLQNLPDSQVKPAWI